MERHPLLAALDRRFYLLCARLGIIPPIGPTGPPQPLPCVEREYRERLRSAHDARAVGDLDHAAYIAQLKAAATTRDAALRLGTDAPYVDV